VVEEVPRSAARPEEDRIAQDVAAKRQALQRNCDAFGALVTAGDRDRSAKAPSNSR
jgi:hypothetical protein